MKKVMAEFFAHNSVRVCALLLIFCFALSEYLDPGIHNIPYMFIPILLAPFYEYVAHKYLLHKIVDPEKNPKAYAFHKKIHYHHHWEPNDISDVFASPSVVIMIVAMWIPIEWVFFSRLAPALMFQTGVIGYFMFYEWCHLAHHMPNYKPLTAYGRLIRQAHSWHHFKNENYWWGVTNPLADYLFGTFKDPKEVDMSYKAKTLGRPASELLKK